MNELLNIIVRFHKVTSENLRALSENLFCLFNQNYPHIQPIIVIQSFTDEEMKLVSSVIDEMPWESGMDSKKLKPILINVPNLSGDHRSKLLNEGITASKGRFLAFLDFDDIIYEDSYSYLIDNLRGNEKNPAICFGKIKRTDAIPFDSFLYLNKKLDVYRGNDRFDLYADNFCPIHSFVIDKEKVEKEDLVFNEDIIRGEDYHLLLRLTAKYESCFRTMNKFIGEYVIRTDASNTSDLPEYRTAKCTNKTESWQNSQEQIEKLKKTVNTKVSLFDLANLNKAARDNEISIQKLQDLESVLVDQKTIAIKLEKSVNIAAIEIQKLNKVTRSIFEHALKHNSFEENEFVGYVDSISSGTEKISFKGWAADVQEKEEAVSMAIAINKTIISVGVLNTSRPDLSKHFGIDSDLLGFDLKIPFKHIEEVKNALVLTLLKNGKVYLIKGPEAYSAFEELLD